MTTRNSWASAGSNLALCVVLACCTPALAQPALFPPLVDPVAQSGQDGAESSRSGDEPIQASSETRQNGLKLVMPRRMVSSKRR